MVTGSAGGIGAAICDHFVELGARVLAVDVAAGSPSGVVGRIERLEVDLLDRAALHGGVETFCAIHGAVDVLINNAGAAMATALSNTVPEDWDADVALNLTGPYNCVEAVKQGMFAAGGGVILNIGSVNGLTALGHPAYSAAKAGLISYTRSLAIEYGPKGLRANVVAPGTVRTQAWNARVAERPQIMAELAKWYPLRTFAEPIDIARACAFLASNDARMITGVVLPVDAGLTAGNPVMAAELTLAPF
jgi:NAD(P)-dependent dehydrogenase (short-subunit alcohol dehydrogenase family)